jgi:hypothetical protein
VEQLEQRELLAADFSCAGVPVGPADNGGVCPADSALVGVENCIPQTNEFGDMSRAGGQLQSRGAARVGKQQGGPVDDGNATIRGTLTTEDALGLIQLREEEKLARDVYLALADMSPIFANIAKAESRHMDAVGQLIAKYGLEDPVGDNAEGVFTNPDFATLYNDLVEAGSESLIEAYKVGAMIEEMDIQDLQDVSSTVVNNDVARVYENLTRGSRNHLRAFAAQIDAAAEAGDPDATYEARFLSQDEFDAIANSSLERGNGEGGQRQRGRVAAVDQTGDVGEPLRLHGRSGDVETGGQRRPGNRHRDGDRQLDRHRDCMAQEDQACDISRETTARDRLFANLGAQGGFRRF